MEKKIRHMGMNMTEKEHERWHIEQREMTSEQHEALMKKMGISDEEDSEWHKRNKILSKTQERLERRPVNPFAIGGGFLDYCVKQGWLTKEGKGRNTRYYVTEEGREELKRFGVEV